VPGDSHACLPRQTHLGPCLTLQDEGDSCLTIYALFAEAETQSMSAPLLQASLEAIETEFWKVVEEAEDPVEVLYGADIDTTITGSGFPQKVCPCLVGVPTEGLEYGPMLHSARCSC